MPADYPISIVFVCTLLHYTFLLQSNRSNKVDKSSQMFYEILSIFCGQFPPHLAMNFFPYYYENVSSSIFAKYISFRVKLYMRILFCFRHCKLAPLNFAPRESWQIKNICNSEACHYWRHALLQLYLGSHVRIR